MSVLLLFCKDRMIEGNQTDVPLPFAGSHVETLSKKQVTMVKWWSHAPLLVFNWFYNWLDACIVTLFKNCYPITMETEVNIESWLFLWDFGPFSFFVAHRMSDTLKVINHAIDVISLLPCFFSPPLGCFKTVMKLKQNTMYP